VSILEGTGTGTTTLSFTVTLDSEVEGGFDVAFASDSSNFSPLFRAEEGTDFTVSTPSPLHFAGTLNETVTINVDITRDAIGEKDERFTIMLGDVTGTTVVQDAAITTGDDAIGTIENDDAPLLTISQTFAGELPEPVIPPAPTLDFAPPQPTPPQLTVPIWEDLHVVDSTSAAMKQEVVVFIVEPVDDSGKSKLSVALRLDGNEALGDLPGLLKRLPDDRYQIYLIVSQEQKISEYRLILDVAIRDGKPTESGEGMEGSTQTHENLERILEEDSNKRRSRTDGAETPPSSADSSPPSIEVPPPGNTAPTNESSSANRGNAAVAALVATPLTAAMWQRRIDQAILKYSERLLSKAARTYRRAGRNPQVAAVKNHKE